MKEKIKILHIIDDIKFIPYCEKTFALSEVENDFFSAKDFESQVIVGNPDLIIVHYLRDECIRVINKIKIDQPVVWFFWGSDGFCLGKFYNIFLLPKTKRSRVMLSFKSTIKNGFRILYKTLLPNSIDKSAIYKNRIKSFGKISIVVPVVPGDYNLLLKNYPISATSFHLNYVNPIFDQSNDFSLTGNNILLGNSAHFSNNHLEMINALSELDLGNRKIVIPLSYGSKANSTFIASYAEKKLTHNAECLIDFLPLIEYQKIIQSCSIVIMNSLRQQALGNIVQSLMMGSHVYLQPTSTLYSYLKDNQFIISTVASISTMRTLSFDEQEYNKKKTREIFGKDAQHLKVRQLIKKALQKNNHLY